VTAFEVMTGAGAGSDEPANHGRMPAKYFVYDFSCNYLDTYCLAD
jgi:hypothetical protein